MKEDTYFPIRIEIMEGPEKGKVAVVDYNEIPMGISFKVLQTNVMPECL
jgi:hypothetical protein